MEFAKRGVVVGRMWEDVKRLILKHHYFLITTHVHPDGDGVGAAIALAELLRQMDKKVRIVFDSPLPKRYRFLDQKGDYERYQPDGNYHQTEVLFVLDTHRKERIGRLTTLMEPPFRVESICIDHHMMTETFTPYVVVDAAACSVGAMLWALYKEWREPINLVAARGIYASVICDTGRFSYGTTSPMAHRIADECMRLGVDPDQMYSRLFQSVTLPQFQMVARALQRMETFFNQRLVIQQLLRSDYADFEKELGDLEQVDFEFIHELNKSIEGVECVMLLTEEGNGKVRVSARSKNMLDVGELMQKLGGGGHRYAAGATLSAPIAAIKESLLKLTAPYLETVREVAG